MNFERIPAELKAYPQWVVWKYVQRDDGKWTKLPYNPRSMLVASVTDYTTWADFDTAVATAGSVAGVAGIGFVLTDNDPFCFADLDDPYAVNPDNTPKFPNADEIMERQRQVMAAMPSYAELSPSGRGLHIISIGGVPKGKRRGAFELYSSERYMTMTGNVYNDVPISAQQPAIDWLYNQLGGTREVTHNLARIDQPERETDEEVLKHAFSAANGEKVQAMYEARWNDAGYGSQSEADWALIDNLQFYTSNQQQIRRIFMASGLGQREKAKRAGYVQSMIDRSFDRIPAEINLDDMREVMDRQFERETAEREIKREAAVTGVKHAFSTEGIVASFSAPAAAHNRRANEALDFDPDAPSPYLAPIPGLMGAIAYFIYRAAPRPIPEIAVAGAIGLMAGICGRAYNVNSTGLNVYVLLLARTGRGKEAIATGIQRLMAPVKSQDGGGGVPGADEFIGPQEIASGQALIKYMAKTSRSFVSIISEFDSFLNSLTQRNVPAPVAKLKQVLLYAYGRSGQGQRIDKSIYSEAEKNVPVIPAPAISLIGEGTPDRFYELLSEDLISDGFLPRFSVIEYDGPRPDANPFFATVQPEPELVGAVARLAAHCLGLNSREAVVSVDVMADAKAMLDDFDRECTRKINSQPGRAITDLWNRAHLKSLKLAALIAVGVNFYAPTIDVAGAAWAIACARHDTARLAARFERGAVGVRSADQRQIDDVRGKLVKLFDRKIDATHWKLSNEAISAGVFSRYFVQSQVANLLSFREDRRGAALAFDMLMKSLTSSGVISEVGRADKERLGVVGAAYAVMDWDWMRRSSRDET